MKIVNRDKDYPNNLKTEQQWAKLGYLPVNRDSGEEMWTTGYCKKSAFYFRKQDVKEATQDELDSYWKPIKAARNQQARERNAKLRAEKKAAEDRKKKLERLQAAAALPAETPPNSIDLIVFDVETTGLNPEQDEILQISIIDGNGQVLLNSYVKPYFHTKWPEASKINGITHETIETAPYPEMLIPIVKGIFNAAKLLVAYNNSFDLAFLKRWGIDVAGKQQVDVMLEFADVYQEKDDYHDGYKWQKLSTAAQYYGYGFSPHDSLEDVKATLHVYKHMFKIS